MQSLELELEQRLMDDRRTADPACTDEPSLPNDTEPLHKDEDSSDHQPGSSSGLLIPQKCRHICSLSVMGRAMLDLLIMAPSIYFLLFAITAAWNDGRPASSDLSRAILKAAPLVSCVNNGDASTELT